MKNKCISTGEGIYWQRDKKNKGGSNSSSDVLLSVPTLEQTEKVCLELWPDHLERGYTVQAKRREESLRMLGVWKNELNR